MTTIQLDALLTAQRLTTELRHNVARLLTLDGHDADLAAIAMRGAEMVSDALLKLRPPEVVDLDGFAFGQRIAENPTNTAKQIFDKTP